MRRVVPLLGACALLFASFASPAPAASDAVTTLAYVRADYAFTRTADSHIAASKAGIENVLARVTRECPKAAAGSPQNHLSEHLTNEVIGAMVLEAGKPDKAAALRFVAAVRGLHWSNALLNRSIHGYAAKLKVMSGLTVPNLCSDIAAWTATGYASLPASTVSFDNAFLPNWVPVGFLPHGLSASESGEAHALTRRAVPLESALVELESIEVYKWADILNELVLNP